MRSIAFAATGLALLLLVAGCNRSGPPSGATVTGRGSGADDTTDRRPSGHGGSNSDAAASTWDGPVGTIEGTVRFVGAEVPQPTVVVNAGDSEICGAEVSKRDIEISPETRGIRSVLVWVDDLHLPDGYKPPRQDITLDNRRCQFEPHAAATTIGSTIEATNSDDLYHTTKLTGAASENIALVGKGAHKSIKVRRVGTIAVRCDKHSWMQAFIRVDAHSFHAVTDVDGRFRIAGVPVGTYKLSFWHERFLEQSQSVSVVEGEVTAITVDYPAGD